MIIKGLLTKLSLFFGSLIITIGLCEIFFRVFIPAPQTIEVKGVNQLVRDESKPMRKVEQNNQIEQIMHFGGPHGVRLTPNVNAIIHQHVLSKRDVNIDINSLGLRYPEIGPKENGEYRVLVLGDSITFGDYVQANETYTGILEEKAQAQGKKIKFINAGIPGASLSEEVYHYLELRDYIKPDMVLLGLYLNDSQNSKSFYSRRLPGFIENSRFLSWLVKRFAVLTLRFTQESSLPEGVDKNWKEVFRNGRDLRSGDAMNKPDGFDYEIYNAYMDFGLAWNKDSWEFIRIMIQALQEETKKENTQFGVFLLPIHIQIMGTVKNFIPQGYFKEMCSKLGVACFDPLPDLRDFWQQNKTLNERMLYDHCHYTPMGNRALADSVYGWLEKSNYLTK